MAAAPRPKGLSIDEARRRKWDVIVVGTGMGGATLGLALARSGQQVLFVEKGRDRIPSEDLVKQMTADDLSIWHEYGRGHSVTQREVATLLRKLQIYPRGIAVGKRRVKGYYADDFFQKQIFERILSRDPLLRSGSETAAKPKAKRAKTRKRNAQ